MELAKVYEPQQFEPHWAQWWIDRALYVADSSKPGRTFSIVIPPPNVTGRLHMGHMLDHTMMDVAVRWHRMLGDNTLWLPGLDHAGIATQMVVERELAKEGKTRQDLGREEFERRVWQWKEQYGDSIIRQMIRLGDSCDWSRERFTLDEGLSRAVRETFVRLYEKGLIYRGEYMVNWCPRCNTAISDLETVHQERDGHLWHIRYPVQGSDRYLVVATTRPETMLGDTAVAVHPRDARYQQLHGKCVTLPLMNRSIPIILDTLADPEFGTGVVKITPAHDPNDFEVGKRHNLPFVKVISELGVMTAEAGPFAGHDRFDARKHVVAMLSEQGLLDQVEAHRNSVGTCQRCGTVVEPLVSTQWFVKMKPLAEPAITAVTSGRIRIQPENWEKVYLDWMTNIRDWCISRQLWWGHRIPAWHCAECSQITVSRDAVTACAHCGSGQVEQETDVLDTWFSSGLWPFSTLGWPDRTPDLDRYYPTTVMITGFDILFFWVARMIVLGLECTGEVPFRDVFIHGLVRDAERQKMSKTKGNVVDPIEVTQQYGTDAVRLSLLMGAAPGQDISFTTERLESARNFANKIWNAARFIQMNRDRSGVTSWQPIEQDCCVPEPCGNSLQAALEDRWIFSRLNRCAEQTNAAIAGHRYHEAAQLLWHFFWHEFCDWYLEVKKLRFQDNSGLNADWRNLLTVYEMALRLLHPIMPFLTEELWQRLVTEGKGRPISISLTRFPQYHPDATNLAAEHEWSLLEEMITTARNLKHDVGVDARQVLDGVLYPRNGASEVAQRELEAIQKIARVNLQIQLEGQAPPQGALRSTPEFDLLLHVPAAQASAQKSRIEKETQQLTKNIGSLKRQLDDAGFLSKAPANVVEGMRAKLADYEAQYQKNLDALRRL